MSDRCVRVYVCVGVQAGRKKQFKYEQFSYLFIYPGPNHGGGWWRTHVHGYTQDTAAVRCQYESRTHNVQTSPPSFDRQPAQWGCQVITIGKM